MTWFRWKLAVCVGGGGTGYRWPSLTSLILDTKKGGIVSVAIVRLVKSTGNGPANLEANLFESTRRGKSMAESQTFSPTCNGGTESAVGWPMQCNGLQA